MAYIYSTIYDAEGNFIDSYSYPSEIHETYIDDLEFVEVLSYESLAEELQVIANFIER